jgi:hypothetical protein
MRSAAEARKHTKTEERKEGEAGHSKDKDKDKEGLLKEGPQSAAAAGQAGTGPRGGGREREDGGTEKRAAGSKHKDHRDSSKTRDSTKTRESVKADRKETLRRKTIEAFDAHHPLPDDPSNPNQGSVGRMEALSKVEVKTAARQRRKSIASAPTGSGEPVGDIYASLLLLAKDSSGDGDGKKHRNFDKLNKHAGMLF